MFRVTFCYLGYGLLGNEGSRNHLATLVLKMERKVGILG